jgi:H+/Cl- antiporter ClcA
MHKSFPLFKKWFPNIYIRIAVGGCAIILLTLLEGSGDYNGAGMGIVAAALAGSALPWALSLKLYLRLLPLAPATGRRNSSGIFYRSNLWV